MAFELIILGALIFVFLISFCGLLQKIKHTYERERVLAAQMLADRMIRRREQEIMRDRSRSGSGSFTEVYLNSSFVGEGVFPGAPPAYSQFYQEPPPKYDDVVKVHGLDNLVSPSNPRETETLRTSSPTTAASRGDLVITVPPTEIRTISSEVSSNERIIANESNPPSYSIAISSA